MTAAAIDMATMQARRAEAKRNADALRQMCRYRLDYRWQPDGRLTAYLTVTLMDGHVMRFASHADPRQVAEQIMGIRPEVAGFLGKIWKGVKKVTKKVATSGVFKMASTALAAAAPVLGPMAPAALAAAAGMKATTALLAARTHAANGNKDAAAKLVEYASKAADVGDAIQLKAAVKVAAPLANKAIAKPAPKPTGKPTMKALPKGVSFAKPAAAKPAATVPLNAAVRDHAQQASARLYTMMLRPA